MTFLTCLISLLITLAILQMIPFLVFWAWVSCSAAKAFVTDNKSWRLSKKQDWLLYNLCLYRLFYGAISETPYSCVDGYNEAELTYREIKNTNDYLQIIGNSFLFYLLELIALAVLSFVLIVILIVILLTFPICFYLFLIISVIAFVILIAYFSLRLARYFCRLQKKLNQSGKKVKF
ncbi:MAG: hypothetical protein WCT16_04870 [Candidatus Buchananbacteria bacterium]